MIRRLIQLPLFALVTMCFYSSKQVLDDMCEKVGLDPVVQLPEVSIDIQTNDQRGESPTLETEKDWVITTATGGKIVVDNIPAWQGPGTQAAIDATEELPYVAETHYHRGTFPLSSIVEGGPAAPFHSGGELVWPAKDKEDAVCHIRTTINNPKSLFHELPHNLQQLLRCFSWWRLNPTQNPVIVTELMPRPQILKDLYAAMQEVFNVRIHLVSRKERTSKVFDTDPYVRVPIPWREMSKFNETYAMNDKDAQKLVKGMLDHYLPEESRAGCKSNQAQPVIAFLNREGSRRHIANHKDIRNALKEAGFDFIYHKSFDNMTMVDQMKFMSQADIVLGPHGAQFSNTIWQPECGSLLEFMPKDYYTPNFFGSLAALSGKHHFFTYPGGPVDEVSNKMREVPNYTILPEVVVAITHKMVERWQSCCKYGFRG